ncbi:hypothetical protein T4D_16981 [Trichinella pseudospiralis]|uniref:Uncharacterized protein n=1 Tax=Trichinella pseudospiralis TaxID=6337 RepID=A0A0V1FAN9_TRIPS|nr:hypothetical protein T4D_16981 [Trichinella pseudospiralis]
MKQMGAETSSASVLMGHRILGTKLNNFQVINFKVASLDNKPAMSVHWLSFTLNVYLFNATVSTATSYRATTMMKVSTKFY